MEVRAERRYRLADVYAMPEDHVRREVIDGVLFVSPAPSLGHQRVVRALMLALHAWCEANGGEVLPGAVNVDLADDTHLEPDLVVLTPRRWPPPGDTVALAAPPDIVVEVSSPSTRAYDTGLKRARYGRAGTPEFWFVDLDAGTVEVSHVAPGGGYGDPRVLLRGDTVTSPVLPGFALPVEDVLRAAV